MFKQRSILALATIATVVSLGSIVSPVTAHNIGTGYVNGAQQFPETRATQVRQTIRLIVPTNDITQLEIAIPKGTSVGTNITLYNDTTQRRLSGIVRINLSGQIEIDLPQPLALNTQMTIDLNNVHLWGTVRDYRVYSKSLNSSGYTYLGSANFHSY